MAGEGEGIHWWKGLGNPKRLRDRGQLIEESHKVYADSRPGAGIQAGSQVWRFTNEITANERIVTYAKDTREYLVGTVIKEHKFDPIAIMAMSKWT